MHYQTIFFALFVARTTLATPLPTYDNTVKQTHSYSGAAGSAPGGSVNFTPASDDNLLAKLIGTTSVLKVNSNNAGPGGISNSGDALGGASGISGHSKSSSKPSHSNVNSEAFTGVGGQTPGGSVSGSQDGLISLGSGNGAAGGVASSGDSVGSLSHGIL